MMHRIASHRIALAVAAALIFGVLLGAATDRIAFPRTNRHYEIRYNAILSHAAQEDFQTVVLGDSIVELAHIPTLCGAPSLNAGLAGGGVADILKVAPGIIAAERPERVIIAVGVNDGHAGSTTRLDTFVQEYRQLITAARRYGAHVVVANIAPVGSARFDKAKVFDPAAILR